ncbi:Metallo-hydrolase/oxidoreductase [Testicularia cyperi]|uniref:Protein-lysine N-methyltransferase EFM4 n=1 Tax=Testicularia cyperi TaxID=1882483 RepID=A0A317XJI2_9BASI|nr:Metallo-hydrolase/oxidoreductase [Testicularia cyperi]
MTSSAPATVRWSVSEPAADPTVQPAFYRTNPPPHWTKVPKPSSETAKLDISKRIFESPWPSSDPQGFVSFLRTRLFEWDDEPPLPPKQAAKEGDAVLPPVHTPTWTAPDVSAEDVEKGVTFTWLGHAICHLQIPIGQGRTATILCDPVLSQRVSPVQWFGPARYTDAPVSVEDIIEATQKDAKNAWPDLLVLSHSHYDHMDYNTIQKLLNPPASAGVQRPHVFCTLGNKPWFQSNFGLLDSELTECDWWQGSTVTLDGHDVLKVTCVPGQHFAGRTPFDRNRTLWAGWTFKAVSPASSGANVYFAGDTGYRSVPRGMPKEQEDTLPSCPAFKEIGESLGPFDVSMIPIGAYLPRHFMSTVHLAPQDSVLVHRDVRSKRSYGIHWGSFRLTPEDVNEPPKLLAQEAERIGLHKDEFQVLQIGQTVFVPVAGEASTSPPTTAATTTITADNITAEESKTADEALPESKLGTKQHWDSVYEREVANFNELGEEGEVWFGEDAVMRMIKYLERYYTETNAGFDSESNPPTVLDVGTGNGHLLFEMLESSAELDEVVSADSMVGVDYSQASIELAQAIAVSRSPDCSKITFLRSDLLDPPAVEQLTLLPRTHLNSQSEKWDLVCDKGTLDAIALSSQPINGRLPIDLYTSAIATLTKPGGLFLITSCNFTETELTDRFTNAGLVVESVIPTPTFSFGGSKGSTTTTIAFRQP